MQSGGEVDAGGGAVRHLDIKYDDPYGVAMRATLTLEPEVAHKLEKLADQRRCSFNAVVNEVLRIGLAATEPARRNRGRFRVQPHSGGFQPGVDVTKLNQLADELEAGTLDSGESHQ